MTDHGLTTGRWGVRGAQGHRRRAVRADQAPGPAAAPRPRAGPARAGPGRRSGPGWRRCWPRPGARTGPGSGSRSRRGSRCSARQRTAAGAGYHDHRSSASCTTPRPPATWSCCPGRATSAAPWPGSRPPPTPRTCSALSYAQQQGGAEAIFGNLAGNLCEGTGDQRVRGGRRAAGHPAAVGRAAWPGSPGGWSSSGPAPSRKTCRWLRWPRPGEAFLTGTTRDVQPIRQRGRGRCCPRCPAR